MRRWRENAPLRYSTPTLKFLLLGSGALGLSAVIKLAEYGLNTVRDVFEISGHADFSLYIYGCIVVASLLVVLAVVEHVTRSDVRQIRYMVIRRLCKYKYGNPLKLKDGELEPKVQVQSQDYGYRVRVTCSSAEFNKVASLESVISDCLIGKFDGYAVTGKEEDVASRYVDYYLDNEAVNSEKQDVYNSLEDMRR